MSNILKIKFEITFITALGVCILLATVACTVTPARDDAQTKATDEKTWVDTAVERNIWISNLVDGVAEYVDLLIAGKRRTKERNETSVEIENSSVWLEAAGYQNSTSFNLNLRLPNVEEYWKLKFTSYDEEEERRNTQNTQYRQRQRTEKYGATVGFFQKLGNIKAAFQPRIELQDPLKVTHSLILDQTLQFAGTAQINPQVEFFARSDQGTGISNFVNFAIPLNHIYGLSLINQQVYEDKTHNYAVAHGVAVGRAVTPTSTITYSVFFNSNNRPEFHLASYSFAVAWRHQLLRNVLGYNVTPHIDFAKDNAFTGSTGIEMNVVLKF